ncbi:MAG: hypothetical protein WDW36_000859 [Sanguina aurantia]
MSVRASSKQVEVAVQAAKAATLSSIVLMAGSAQASELAQVVADSSGSDSRIGAIATLFVPVLGWVGFNMLQPLAAQLETAKAFAQDAEPEQAKPSKAKKAGKKVRSLAGAVGMGLATSMLVSEQAQAATEVAQLAESDTRIFAILTLFVPVIGWVLFNMAQPLLAQLATSLKVAAEGADDDDVPAKGKVVKKKFIKKK